ncbi:MAG: aldo/keto reductase family protein [Nostocales cyanobacterium LacPavin_0920_SED1_MAG_38_18]|jgi:aryl-alcohol dehydrogenase-like predicted oxidoreductase|uniref:Aldo/keto reductase family protein n=1 Tax=Aphanizomenon flos-aquae FACHB-1040 TaxID=2692887 RepID=A0ABR8BVQ4_APHFL|nr:MULTISPECIES: aldo/keto reductase family protein [Nostocales]ALB42449.1 voltage-gated potassium channel [Anabaena sp. WA102]MBD2278993.1 aldo/keto reductase family protein [Aphanizomenon flos-aquae FACHB-1040]MBO1069269.1 aldo/keto reductase [Dolichospermum sp. DEX189]MCX5983342.1 aldo/keto reductase family protein [Nostocales cyanobacterium LacPavin_0920_SED1_MAG_38_18]
MKYRQLGNSELHVSEISLGSWGIYEGVEQQNVEASIHKAFDVGINLIDTSNSYAAGGAESFLGEVLQGIERSSYILATKVFFPMSPTDQGLSAVQIKKQIDASLKRLCTDYIDLYQCHRYDPNTPLEETMMALTEVVHQGKARYIGFSEWSPEQIQAAFNLADVEHFVSSQPQYSMLWREPEAEVFPLCATNGVGQIVWSPLAQGILTGKYQPGQAPPQDSRAANEKMNLFLLENLFSDRILTAVQKLKPIAQDLNLSMAQLALAWVLHSEYVSSAIIGASRPEQIVDNAAASGVQLNADVLAAIDQELASVCL